MSSFLRKLSPWLFELYLFFFHLDLLEHCACHVMITVNFSIFKFNYSYPWRQLHSYCPHFIGYPGINNMSGSHKSLCGNVPKQITWATKLSCTASESCPGRVGCLKPPKIHFARFTVATKANQPIKKKKKNPSVHKEHNVSLSWGNCTLTYQ